jgi:signal transduction histidine kinase
VDAFQRPLTLLLGGGGEVLGAPAESGLVGRTIYDLTVADCHEGLRALVSGRATDALVTVASPGRLHTLAAKATPFDVGGPGPRWLVTLSPPAESAALALEEMVSVVAHEVKNPLAGIGGALEVVGARSEPASTEARILREAHNRVRALDETLEDLLLLTRPLALERGLVSLAALLQEAIEQVTLNPAAEGISLTLEDRDLALSADRRLLRRALFYVIDHGRRVGQGDLHVTASATPGGATVRVYYVGGVLERDIRDRIFDPRYLTRSRRTGLHLPVAARIVHAMGGRIQVWPEGDGSTIGVDLPGPAGRITDAAG